MGSLLYGSAVIAVAKMPPEIALQRVLDERAAAEFVGLSAVTLERMRKLGTAPKHIMLSPRRLGYRICDLLTWLDARASDRAA